MVRNSEVNITYEWFAICFVVFFFVYGALLILLTSFYIPTEYWLYYFLVQMLLVALAIITDHFVPKLTESSTDVPILLIVKPILFASQFVHIFGLGRITLYYEQHNALFVWILYTLTALHGLLFFGMGGIKLSISRTKTKETSAHFTYEIPAVSAFMNSMYAQDQHDM